MTDFAYQGTGGLELSGSADIQAFQSYVGAGGLTFGGTAIVVSSAIMHKSFTGTGGLIASGTATVLFFSSGGVLENEQWTNDNSVEGEFLWARLQHQANPFACRDTGPEIIGDITDGILTTVWTLVYSTSTGEFALNDEVQFSALGVTKVDFTFDVYGYPVYTYVTADGNLYVRYRDIDTSSYTTQHLDTESSQCFICLAERRLPWSYDNNKIYLVYAKDNQVLCREFLKQLYTQPYSTSLEAINSEAFTLEGIGVTADNRLQIRAVYTYN